MFINTQSRLSRLLQHQSSLWALAAAAAILVNLMAVLLTEWRHLHPCPLCIAQRTLYLGIAALSLVGFVVSWWRGWRELTLALTALTLLLCLFGVGMAAYQSWLQLTPDTAVACGVGEANPIERMVEWLAQYSDFFLATGNCSSKEWTFLSLSIANWSLLVFAGLAVVTTLAGRASSLMHRR